MNKPRPQSYYELEDWFVCHALVPEQIKALVLIFVLAHEQATSPKISILALKYVVSFFHTTQDDVIFVLAHEQARSPKYLFLASKYVVSFYQTTQDDGRKCNYITICFKGSNDIRKDKTKPEDKIYIHSGQ